MENLPRRFARSYSDAHDPAGDDCGSLDPGLPVRADAWPLDSAVVMLNHGSFGACPRPVLERQAELRQQMEAEPVRFLVRQVQPLLDESRRALAELIDAEPENLLFVSNATAGVNAVVRSLRFRPGDELLVTNHGYNACNNVVRYVAERDGASVVAVDVPIPIQSPEQIVEAVLARVTQRTRLGVIDHITSPTAVILPVERLVRELEQRGVDTLVDGAHGPGMVPLSLRGLGAAYYTGNCHKWLCGPKGAGFLYVRPDREGGLQPPVISHGYNQPRKGYSRLQDAFDWQGTDDPTAWLCVGEAIRFLAGLVPGGMGGLMRRNHELVVGARRMLCRRLPLRPVCPEEMLGSMAAVMLPDEAAPAAVSDPSTSAPPFGKGASHLLPERPFGCSAQKVAGTFSAGREQLPPFASAPSPRLGHQLLERFGIEVPVHYWPAPPHGLLRISAQAYNGMDQYVRLAEALSDSLSIRGDVGTCSALDP